MGGRFIITKKTAEKIIELGTDQRIDLRQKITKLQKRYRKRFNGGHLVGSLSADLAYNAEGSITIDNKIYTVHAPLLRSGETIEAGTVCIIDQDRSGNWNIIAAQCPEN